MATISFKCPNCDGELKFNPSGQNYICEYCGSTFTQEELDAMKRAETKEQTVEVEEKEPTINIDGVAVGPKGASDGTFIDTDHNGIDDRFESYTNFYQGKDKDTAQVFICPSCGAEVVTDSTTAATFCYYCHNPVVLGGRLQGDFLPHRIVPFKIDRKEAEKRFFEFIRKKHYVPKGFFHPKNVEKFTGIYFPYWQYDVDLKGAMQADAKKIRTWRTGNTEYTETKSYHVFREGEISLYEKMENALRKANVDLVTGVLPYNLSQTEEFNMGYLSGFFAEKRDIETRDIADQVHTEMRGYADKLLRETIDFDGGKVKNSDVRLKKENWNYLMLPVWTLTYKGKDGKLYYFSMNGQTGKVYGKLPVDKLKLFLHSALTALAVFGIVILGGLMT